MHVACRPHSRPWGWSPESCWCPDYQTQPALAAWLPPGSAAPPSGRSDPGALEARGTASSPADSSRRCSPRPLTSLPVEEILTGQIQLRWNTVLIVYFSKLSSYFHKLDAGERDSKIWDRGQLSIFSSFTFWVCLCCFSSKFVDAYMTLFRLFYPIWTQQLRPSWSRAIFILCTQLILKVFGSPSKDSALPLWKPLDLRIQQAALHSRSEHAGSWLTFQLQRRLLLAEGEERLRLQLQAEQHSPFAKWATLLLFFSAL